MALILHFLGLLPYFLFFCSLIIQIIGTRTPIILSGNSYVDVCTTGETFWQTGIKLGGDGIYYDESLFITSGDGFNRCLRGPWYHNIFKFSKYFG